MKMLGRYNVNGEKKKEKRVIRTQDIRRVIVVTIQGVPERFTHA